MCWACMKGTGDCDAPCRLAHAAAATAVMRLALSSCALDSVAEHQCFCFLMQVNPDKRLGCGPGGIQEIKNHRWFSRISWDALTNKQLPAPILPRLTSLLDTSNFDAFDDADVGGHHMNPPNPAAAAAQQDGKRAAQWETWQWVTGLPPAGAQGAAVKDRAL